MDANHRFPSGYLTWDQHPGIARQAKSGPSPQESPSLPAHPSDSGRRGCPVPFAAECSCLWMISTEAEGNLWLGEPLPRPTPSIFTPFYVSPRAHGHLQPLLCTWVPQCPHPTAILPCGRPGPAGRRLLCRCNRGCRPAPSWDPGIKWGLECGCGEHWQVRQAHWHILILPILDKTQGNKGASSQPQCLSLNLGHKTTKVNWKKPQFSGST